VNLNLRLLQIYLTSSECYFTAAVVFSYWQTMKSIHTDQFFFLLGGFILCVALLDVPAGLLADKLGRKRVLVWGGGLMFLGHFCILLSPNFYSLGASLFVLAIAFALISGTTSALLYETLREYGQEKRYRRAESLMRAWPGYAVAVCSLIGIWIYPYYSHAPQILTCIAMLVCWVSALSLEDKFIPFNNVNRKKMPVFGQYTTFSKVSIFYGIALATCLFFMMSMQPRLLSEGADITMTAYFFALSQFIRGIGSHMSMRLYAWGNQHLIGGLSILLIAVSGIATLTTGIIQIIGFVLIFWIFGILSASLGVMINDLVSNRYRATCLSLTTFINRMIYITAMWSMLGQTTSLPSQQWILLSLALAISAIAIFPLGNLLKQKAN
jgi:MFS family permease